MLHASKVQRPRSNVFQKTRLDIGLFIITPPLMGGEHKGRVIIPPSPQSSPTRGEEVWVVELVLAQSPAPNA